MGSRAYDAGMDENSAWDAATVEGWPEDELTRAYDVSLKVSRNAEEPHEMRRIAEENANVAAREMKRRGIFDAHVQG